MKMEPNNAFPNHNTLSHETEDKTSFLPEWLVKQSHGFSMQALIVVSIFSTFFTLWAFLLKIVTQEVDILFLLVMRYTVLPGSCLVLSIALKKDICCRGNRVELIGRALAEFVMNYTWIYGLKIIPVGM